MREATAPVAIRTMSQRRVRNRAPAKSRMSSGKSDDDGEVEEQREQIGPDGLAPLSLRCQIQAQSHQGDGNGGANFRHLENDVVLAEEKIEKECDPSLHGGGHGKSPGGNQAQQRVGEGDRLIAQSRASPQ